MAIKGQSLGGTSFRGHHITGNTLTDKGLDQLGNLDSRCVDSGYKNDFKR